MIDNRLPVDLKDYDLESIAGRKDLVLDCWPLLAGVAYDKFLAAGRGALMLKTITGVLSYILKASDTSAWADEVNQAIADYDPQAEIIVCFDTLYDITARRYSVENFLPPAAHEYLEGLKSHD